MQILDLWPIYSDILSIYNVSILRKFLTTENSLKIKKNLFFMLKALFVLEIFTFLSLLFGYIEKRLDKKAKVNFKIYNWPTNNYNAHFN